MRAQRPLSLQAVEQGQMHQLVSTTAENKAAAVRTLNEAEQFMKVAQRSVADGYRLPAASNFHEAARLATTAVATRNGRARNPRHRRGQIQSPAFQTGPASTGHKDVTRAECRSRRAALSMPTPTARERLTALPLAFGDS